MIEYPQQFTDLHPAPKFVSEAIREVCYAWWLYTPQGRRVVVFTRKLQGLIHIILQDYAPEHLVEAIKKYGMCKKHPDLYWYGMSNYTLEYFLSAKDGELITKFTADPLEIFRKDQVTHNSLEYK